MTKLIAMNQIFEFIHKHWYQEMFSEKMKFHRGTFLDHFHKCTGNE